VALSNLKGFYQPESIREASKLLYQYQDSAMLVGGGTFIHGLVARGLITDVDYLIDLTGLPINTITQENKYLCIGATAIFTDIESHNSIANNKYYAAISDAMTYPPRQIKNAATMGGCLGSACPFLDSPIALLALDAIVVVAGRRFNREIKIEDLFVSLFSCSLKPGEIITEVRISEQPDDTASAFYKLETNANDLAILNSATRLSLKDNKVLNPRIFVGGGVGETPVRCEQAEKVLEGEEISVDIVDKASQVAMDNIDPLSDHRASADYRKMMTRVFVKRSLLKSIERLGVEI
jgi:CO/xanthine dehydrogenase FAD-binding subunit